MGYAWDILAPVNITRVIQQTQEVLTLLQPLVWINRNPSVEGTEDELTMRDRSYIYIADIVEQDSPAAIRDSGDFKFEQHGTCRVKHGFGVSGVMAKLIRRIEKNVALDNEIGHFERYIAKHAASLKVGVQQRLETINLGMLLGGFSYDNLGIKMNAGSFGMPNDLRFTPAVDWDDTSSTPIADMIEVLRYSMVTWGESYNRISLSYQALVNITKTTEFKEIYKSESFMWNIPDRTITTQGQNPSVYLPFLAAYISRAAATSSDGSGSQGRPVTIEINETVYRKHQNDGAIASPTRFHPVAAVLFTNTDDDNSGSRDWLNVEVTESLFASMGGTTLIGEVEGPASGPFSYATQADANLQSPGIVLWCVAEGGPRRHRDTLSAVLTAWS